MHARLELSVWYGHTSLTHVSYPLDQSCNTTVHSEFDIKTITTQLIAS